MSKNPFDEFQTAVLEEFLKNSDIPAEEIKRIKYGYGKELSMARYNIIKSQAINIVQNSQYFSFFTRLKIAKIILFG